MRLFRAAMIVGGVIGLCALVGCVRKGSLSMTVNGLRRTYELYVPPTVSKEKIPLVIALHPLLLDGYAMRRFTGLDEVAGREGFAVVYPDGVLRRWDVFFGGDKDWRFISSLIDELVADHNIDPARVYATGASNGAMLCHVLACKIPEKLAGIAPVMGTPPQSVLDECQSGKKLPVLIIHGTKDWICPYTGNKAFMKLASAPATAAFWAAHNGCSGEPAVTPMPNASPFDGTTIDRIDYPCGENPPVILYRVNGGGHTWPGGGHFLPEWMLGRVSQDMNASEVIWQFFKSQRPAD